MQNTQVQSPPVFVPTDILARSPDRLRSEFRSADSSDAATRDVDLKKASQEFESIFIAYLLKVMRNTIEESGLTEGGFGKEIYTELFDQEMSRSIAQHGALGISDLLYRRLLAQAPVKEHDTAARPGEKSAEPNPVPVSPPRQEVPEGPDSEVPDFKLPLQAPMSSVYGIRRDPFSHQRRFHKGIDLAAPAGTEVRAAKGGEVQFAGYERGYGNSVILRHPEGFQTRYAHLGATQVKAGDVVADEQVLGVVGSTGHTTGPHLHFEVIRNGEPVDPRAAMTE